MRCVEVLVIGAGPAGMMAARVAAQRGASAILLDDQPAAGGQIFRGVSAASERLKEILGSDYRAGESQVRAIELSGVESIYGAAVWKIDGDGIVSFLHGSQCGQIRARHIVLATGALERPVPIPGWTLPGVMTAGAAQILLKSSGLVPERAVLAGSGPLLYLLASQLIAAGQPPAALIETQSLRDIVRATPKLAGALRAWRYLSKGAAMLRTIRQAGVQRFTGASHLQVLGLSQAQGMSFIAGGVNHQITTDHVFLHCGVVPNNQISQSIGVDHRWDQHALCFVPQLNHWLQTSRQTVSVAGDGGGIAGAQSAPLLGEIAALGALKEIGLISAEQAERLAAPIRVRLARELAIRPFLDTAYRVSDAIRRPADDTIVCRCEEVTAGAIRGFAKIGCTGPNQTKAFGRCGMGPCQGRYCSLTVTDILAQENKLDQQQVGSYRIRAPLRPISVAQLASLASEPAGHGDTNYG